MRIISTRRSSAEHQRVPQPHATPARAHHNDLVGVVPLPGIFPRLETFSASKDPDVSFKDEALTVKENLEDPAQQRFAGIEPNVKTLTLTDEMKEGLKAAIVKAFNKEAERLEGDMDAPEYLKESADDVLDSYWNEMSDKESYKWAVENGHLNDPNAEVTDNALSMPTKFDPIGPGTDYGTHNELRAYRETQAFARAFSIENSVRVMQERGLLPEVRGPAARWQDIPPKQQEYLKDDFLRIETHARTSKLDRAVNLEELQALDRKIEAELAAEWDKMSDEAKLDWGKRKSPADAVVTFPRLTRGARKGARYRALCRCPVVAALERRLRPRRVGKRFRWPSRQSLAVACALITSGQT